jgi:hypothetical protein
MEFIVSLFPGRSLVEFGRGGIFDGGAFAVGV